VNKANDKDEDASRNYTMKGERVKKTVDLNIYIALTNDIRSPTQER